MGSISKLDSGKYRAFARVNNKRKTKVFGRKGDARAWLERTEKQLGSEVDKSLFDAFERYERTHSATKKGYRWEAVRLKAFKRQFKNEPIYNVTRSTIAEWRDMRLKTVSGPTVRREMNLLSAVFTTALFEWEWILENPCKGVRRPALGRPRERLYTQDEIVQLIEALPCQASLAFRFALETAMRAGEIFRIEQNHIDGRTLLIPETKTGNSRLVPLSQESLNILKESGHSFNISPEVLSTTFRRTCIKLGIKDATFHDTRHHAITRLSKKLDVLELARVVGHSNINQLLTYYNPDVNDLADKLD